MYFKKAQFHGRHLFNVAERTKNPYNTLVNKSLKLSSLLFRHYLLSSKCQILNSAPLTVKEKM